MRVTESSNEAISNTDPKRRTSTSEEKEDDEDDEIDPLKFNDSNEYPNKQDNSMNKEFYDFRNTKLVIKESTSSDSKCNRTEEDSNNFQMVERSNSLESKTKDLEKEYEKITNDEAIKYLENEMCMHREVKSDPKQDFLYEYHPYTDFKLQDYISVSNKSDYSLGNKSMFENIFGCMKPIMNLWSTTKTTLNNPNYNDDYDVPFEALSDLVWLGSGAQGCVFKGMLNGSDVAIKKVKSKEEANIRMLRKLNHENLVKFKGVSFNGDKFFCIIMEFCPYGQLFTYLNNTKEKTVLKPTQMMNWAKQIASGMNYLHENKIIHRDLKSPNILIGFNNMLKISDFGASKNISEKSTVMSFKGTIAWMAPEVIRNEACSEKVDVYSFGVVLWELLTCEMPYKNFDQNSIMWGVGSNKLQLTIPLSAPDGIKLLLQQCWSIKPRNRPAFSQILKHLDVVAKTEILLKIDDEYLKSQKNWKEEIREKMNISEMQHYNIEEDLILKRKEELRHATEIRELYEQKLEKANNLYFELSTVLLQLDERENDLIKREKALNIRNDRIVRPILRRESSNRSKSYSKGNLKQTIKSSVDIDVSNECQAINMHTAKSAENILSHNNEFVPNSTEMNENLTFSMQNLEELNYQEQKIDTQENKKLDIGSPVDDAILGNLNPSTHTIKILNKLIRSKSVNSVDSYSKNPPPFNDAEFSFSRKDSLPPSYPQVLANRIKTGYYSENNLSFNPDTQSLSIKIPKGQEIQKPTIKDQAKSKRKKFLKKFKQDDTQDYLPKFKKNNSQATTKKFKNFKKSEHSYTNKSYEANISSTNEEEDSKKKTYLKPLNIGRVNKGSRKSSYSSADYSDQEYGAKVIIK